MQPIPVFLELVADVAGKGKRVTPGVRAECAKCGRVASCELGTGGPVARVKAAKSLALKALAAACPHPLPWGSTPEHADRVVPRGVTLYAEDHLGAHWPLWVDARHKLLSAAGGCHHTALVLVAPESAEVAGAAAEFAKELVGRGYLRAVAVKVGFVPKQPTRARQ